MANRCTATLIICLMMSAWTSSAAQMIPRFEDYPVKDIFVGALAALQIPEAIRKWDADRMRESYSYEEGPNFSGRFVVINWTCGSPCKTMAIVDAKDGNVFFPPITDEGLLARSYYLPNLTYPGDVGQNPEIQFRLDSRLLVIKCNDGAEERPYTFYFLWDNDRWTLLRKVPVKGR